MDNRLICVAVFACCMNLVTPVSDGTNQVPSKILTCRQDMESVSLESV